MELTDVVETGADDAGTLVGLPDDGADVVVPVPVLVPLPIVVVIGPLSIYTPDMYQFSGVAVFTMRSTPTWKSSELVEVEVVAVRSGDEEKVKSGGYITAVPVAPARKPRSDNDKARGEVS